MERRQLFVMLLAMALLAGLVACGGGEPTGNDNDATVSSDASQVPDGSSAEDLDHDGYPADQDCDDNDPAIYPGVMEECSSDCAVGVRGCRSDGTWSTCTASTVCSCATPGETQIVPCGRCGQGSQTCLATGVWSFPSDCQGEGECFPGAMEDVACDFCGGTGSRLCNSECQWLPVEGCSGECLPGEIRVGSTGCAQIYEVKEEVCSAECLWEVSQPCTTDCLIPPRVGSGDFNDEVCVSAGDFVMGAAAGTTYPDEEPQHTVSLTAYLIDVYEVTVARYRECVLDGGCTLPAPNCVYFESGKESHAINCVTHDQAVAFCQWDDGRVLPTEAQWEKAARGPYPRAVTDPWGDTAPTCQVVACRACMGGVSGPYSVDVCPAGSSFYGLFNQAANVSEWVADWYDPSYYAASPTLDPGGPAVGQERSVRGKNDSSMLSGYHDTVSRRLGLDPTVVGYGLGFRCARPGY